MKFHSEIINYGEYKDFIEKIKFINLSLYHKAEWLGIVHRIFGIKLFAVVTRYDGGLIALTPIMQSSFSIFKLFGSPLSGNFTEFCGPLWIEAPSNEIAENTFLSIHSLLHKKASYLEWGVNGVYLNSNIFNKNHELSHYIYQPRHTLVVDLSRGCIEVWNAFTSRARNTIRKSEKNGVIAQCEIPNEGEMTLYYSMLRDTFKRQGLKIRHPLTFFLALLDLIAGGSAFFVAARVNNELISAGIFLIDGDRLVFLSGTSNSSGMSLGASSLVQWAAIQEGVSRGLKKYDLNGVGVASIDKFKRSFGGVDFVHHRWLYMPAYLRWACRAIPVLRKMGVI